MVLVALGFVFGAWLLQQQTALNFTFLPASLTGLQAAWMLVPALGVFIYAFFQLHQSQYHSILKRLSSFGLAALIGFIWAASFAAIRLSEDLPVDWQQKSITVVGVVASLPEVTERGERFKFDVEKTLTKNAKIPQHISLNFYHQENKDKYASEKLENAPKNSIGKTNFFHPTRFKVGQRWQFTVRLKRPHTTYNPHGFDFEA